MDIFIRNKPYTGPVKAVVLDWAGTAVDFGSIGPAAVFVDVFSAFSVEVTIDEARRFMGLAKIDHIRAMCALPSVAARWEAAHGRPPVESDVLAMYEKTEPMMIEALKHHCDLIPGLRKTVQALREQGVKIGSSTGYTRPMMDVLVPAAAEKGYAPDAVVCSSDVPAGRPFPYMCWQNAIKLQVHPAEAVVKIGDTLTDIQEGLNAGMWTVGVTRTGNELGLSCAEIHALGEDELRDSLRSVRDRFLAEGAHFTAEGVWEILPVIEQVNELLSKGERP